MDEQKKKQHFKKKILILILILGVAIVGGVGIAYVNFYNSLSTLKRNVSEYNEAVRNYNTVVEEFKKIKEITSLENIDGLPKTSERKAYIENEIGFLDALKNDISQDAVARDTENLIEETSELLYAFILAQQITNPSEEWIIERLKLVDGITDIQAVTEECDPNNLLGVDGGYTSCVYFTVNNIAQDSVSGKDIIDKGTDAGGAIEVYSTVNDAKNRCKYLGQFDNTLLYSGSYAIVGTTVIRTSYLLTNEQQVELTNKITTEFTALK